MSTGPRLAYAHARVQAHLTRLPSDQDWERLASARTLSAYLEEARSSGFAAWVRPFSGLSQPHDLERGCLAIARDSVRVTADWAPPGWRMAIEWLAWIPALVVLEHLLRSGVLPDWVATNDPLRGLVAADGVLDPDAVAAAGLTEFLDRADPEELGERWNVRWRGCWPICRGSCRRDLVALAGLVQDHLDVFRRGSSSTAWDERRALRARLRTFLHLHPVRPVALFAYLGILFIDLERLRGALLSRAVFESSGDH
jgi:hypothetical protein